MDDPRDREILAYYPYVVVRLGCDRCTRTGAFRLARLAAKFGSNISLDHLIAKLVATECPYWKARHPYHGTCRARLIDLDGFREVPDLPPAILKLPDVARTAAALAKRALRRACWNQRKRWRWPHWPSNPIWTLGANE
jgi:hypothetical protein